MQFVLLIIALFMAPVHISNSTETQVSTENHSDAYFWITVYDRYGDFAEKQVGGWCMPPHSKMDKRVFRTQLLDERFLLSHDRCRSHVWVGANISIAKSRRITYYIEGTRGKYFLRRGNAIQR